MSTHPADQILQRYWGHESLRPAQRQAIDAVLAGRDTLALMPTGGGKSVCYQIPALLLPGLTLVVSPLIALMEDQVAALQKKGIPAAYVNSTLPLAEIAARMEQAATGKLKLLYLTPERIATESFSAVAPYLNVSLIAVDEAHCISEWGHDFRPAYRHISRLRKLCPASIIALTATATARTGADVCRSLGFGADFEVARETLRRPNLSYNAIESETCPSRLLDLIRGTAGSAIVYCGSRADVLATARMLEGNGLSAAQYHGGLNASVRSSSLRDWMAGKKQTMVATNAFGMGIDKADVRLVVHRYIPPSPEDYFQQAGRAGRDGLPGRAVVLYDRKALATMKRLSRSQPDPQTVSTVYRRLCSYLCIAPGEGTENLFPFSPEEFRAYTGLENQTIREALAALVRGGVISLSESEELTAKARVLASPPECYALPEGPAAAALEALVRSCDGIFGYLCPLELEKLAALAALTVADFEKALQTLTSWGIIEYRPGRKYHTLALSIPRDDAWVKNLLTKTSEAAAALRQGRAERMEEYLHTPGCRARWIETYFGENRPDDCGICDRCAETHPGSDIEKILAHGPLSAREIARKAGWPEEKTIEALRALMEAERVSFDGRGRFHLTPGK